MHADHGFLHGSWGQLALLLLSGSGSAALAGPGTSATQASQNARTLALAFSGTDSSIRTSGNCAWTDVPSPNTGSPHNTFTGVAAIATNDVWAVGAYGIFGNEAQQLVAHWSGMSWSLATTPALALPNQLTAVSATGSSDVWAVGGYDSGGQALIQHWDGSSWSVVAHPNPGLFNRFYGVAAVSSSEVWAVGLVDDGGLQRTLVERWDGASWTVVPSPNVPNQHNHLNSITAVPGSPNEAWAVGTAGVSELIMHWDGAQWSIVPGPNSGINPYLTSVVALSANDVWAVGYTGTSFGVGTLIEHWNGSAWSVVPSPNPSSTYNHLLGVAAVSANDVWAVGDFNALGGHGRTLMLRWNGSAWVHVPGDNTGPVGLPFFLNAVSAISGSDVWTVGTNSHTLAEHWNGAKWTIAPTDNLGVGTNMLNGVSGSSSTDVWQVGYFNFGTEQRTLTQHWNGAAWALVRSPNTNKRLNVLEDVAAISPSNAWAVGTAHSGSAPDATTLILNWDGEDWRIVPSPSPGTAGSNELHGVAAVAADDIWAVGNFWHAGSLSQILIEHWDGASWSVVPGANVPGVNNGLFSVVALAADDVWAVGYYGNVEFSPLVVHWDGSTWDFVPSPDPQGSSNILRGVTGSGSSDVWSVGTSKNLLTNMTGTLTEHWDGSDWSFVNPAQGVGVSSGLYGVAAVSPADAWQVGDFGGLALIGRWNGSEWNVFQSPAIAGRLHGATAITPGDVWAVGQRLEEDVGVLSLSEHFVCDIELYCFCDAGGGCANANPSGGCANSTGSGASLSHSVGSTSVAADDLVLGAAQLPPSILGIFFMGGAQANLPFFDGRLCIAPGNTGIFRYPLQPSGTTGSMALGPGIVTHSQTFPSAGKIQPGSTWHFQTWYRDPTGPCGTGSNLTNGLKADFTP